jgi:hypothetical protein
MYKFFKFRRFVAIEVKVRTGPIDDLEGYAGRLVADAQLDGIIGVAPVRMDNQIAAHLIDGQHHMIDLNLREGIIA